MSDDYVPPNTNIRRMVGRKIVDCQRPSAQARTNTYIIAWWKDDTDNLKIQAERFEVDNNHFVFYRGHDVVLNIPAGNVLYVWRDNAV